MKFIKKHRGLMLFMIFFIILMIVAGIFLKGVLLSEDSNDKYGNRLNGIEAVQITDSRFQTVKEHILNNKSSNQISYNVTGRIIKFFIEVKTETDELTVESLLNIILDNFTDVEKSFYDFQVFVTNEEKEEELYPMIAYKHRNNTIFTITKKVGEKNEE